MYAPSALGEGCVLAGLPGSGARDRSLIVGVTWQPCSVSPMCWTSQLLEGKLVLVLL